MAIRKKIFSPRLRKKEPELLTHPEGPCPNCAALLGSTESYCPHCGQKRLEKEDMSFHHMIGESFLDYFHFDSSFFRTVKPLLFNPGWLTVQFMNGRRKSFVEPFRLFLVVSVIYFLLLPLNGESTYETGGSNHPVKGVKEKSFGNQPLKYTVNGVSMPITRNLKDSLRIKIDSAGGLKNYVEKEFKNDNWFIKLILRQGYKILAYSAQSFTTVLEHTASKMIFLLIPIFALILKLIYRKSRRLYFEHLIFSLHMHAFLFLMLVLWLLLDFITPVSLWFVILVAIVYLFFAMRKNYGEKTGRTIRKELGLLFFYCVVSLPVFFLLLLMVSLFLV